MPAASKNRTSPRGQGSSSSSGSRSHPYQPGAGASRRGQASNNNANGRDDDTTKEAQEVFWRERSGTGESGGLGGGTAGAGGKRHLSCENCRMRKMRCSRQSPCLSCRMRGDECVWVGTPPGGVAEEDELKSTNDEIERLKKLVDLLLERLEEQNEAEEQQQARLAAATAAGGSGGSVGYPAHVGGLPPTSSMTNPYQAHFAALSQPQQQQQQQQQQAAAHVYGVGSTSDIRVHSPQRANSAGGASGRPSFPGSANGFPAHLMSAETGSSGERSGSMGD